MIPKPKRIADPAAVKAARKDSCELCYKHARTEVHHIKSRGAGGDDLPANMIALCPICHHKVHQGNIPRERLRKIKGRT